MRPAACIALIIALLPALLGCSSNETADYVDESEETAGDDGVISEDTLLSVETVAAVHNGGKPPSFEIETPHRITEILTYHWNGGTGAGPGEISLQGEDGKVYGPWEAAGEPGQGDVADAYWRARPEEVVPAGTYTLMVSDPKTWSQNDETQGFGVAFVHGVPAE